MKAFAIHHVAFEDLGNLHSQLTDRGYEISYFSATNPQHMEILSQEDPDLLVVLGGPIGVYEEQDYPFLVTEKKIIEMQLERNRPVIGICLGAQLIASTLGARVYSGSNKEIGWRPITTCNTDKAPWAKSLDGENVLHWHGDTFDIPSGATLFASSRDYPNQAFTYGTNVLALQFHIEVLPNAFEQWLVGHACEISGYKQASVNDLRNQCKQHAEAMQALAASFWADWFSARLF